MDNGASTCAAEPLLPTIRLMLVSRSLVAREAVSTMPQPAAGLTMVAEADTVQAALEGARSTSPDVILSGACLPGLVPVHLAANVRNALGRPIPVLVVTFHTDDAVLAHALGSQVAGYLSTDITFETLRAAIVAVGQGLAVFGPHARELIAQHARQVSSLRSDTVHPSLTPREDEVFRYLVQGLTNREIAERLQIGLRMAEVHVSRVLRKLRARSRTEAVVAGLRGHIV